MVTPKPVGFLAPSSIGRWEFPMAPKSLVSHYSGSQRHYRKQGLKKQRKLATTKANQLNGSEWYLSPIDKLQNIEPEKKNCHEHIVICGVLQKQQF